MKRPPELVGAIAGDAEARFRADLEDALRRARGDDNDLIADLQAVERLSYQSAVALLRAHYLLATHGRKLVIVAPDRATLMALERVGVGGSLRVCETLSDGYRLLGSVEQVE